MLRLLLSQVLKNRRDEYVWGGLLEKWPLSPTKVLKGWYWLKWAKDPQPLWSPNPPPFFVPVDKIAISKGRYKTLPMADWKSHKSKHLYVFNVSNTVLYIKLSWSYFHLSRQSVISVTTFFKVLFRVVYVRLLSNPLSSQSIRPVCQIKAKERFFNSSKTSFTEQPDLNVSRGIDSLKTTFVITRENQAWMKGKQ